MSVADFLFQGSPPAAVSSSVTAEAALPEWYQEYLRGTVARANAVIDQPYQTYSGQRLADVNADQTAAFDKIRAAAGDPTTWQQPLQQAQGWLTQGATYDPTQVPQYRNPYVSGVLDVLETRANRNFNEQVLPSLNNAFTGGGQFGSSRHAALSQNAARDMQESLMDQERQVLFDAENQAQQNYFNWANAQRSAAGQLGSLASMGRGLTMQDALALQASGQQQQQLDQQSLDLGYQDWTAQRDYPLTQVGYLSNLIRGLEMPTDQVRTSASNTGVSGASPLTQISGAIGGYYGWPSSTSNTASTNTSTVRS